MHGFISGLSFLFLLLYVFVLMPMPYSFNDYRFTMQFRIIKYDASRFLLLSQNCFGYLGVFGFSIYFRIVFSTDVKNDFGILTGIVLSL